MFFFFQVSDAEKLADDNKKKDRALLHQRIESDKEVISFMLNCFGGRFSKT